MNSRLVPLLLLIAGCGSGPKGPEHPLPADHSILRPSEGPWPAPAGDEEAEATGEDALLADAPDASLGLDARIARSEGEPVAEAPAERQVFAGPSTPGPGGPTTPSAGFGIGGGSPSGGMEAKDESRPVPTDTWQRAAAAPNDSTLSIGDGEELPMKGMQAGVWIEGHRARVVLDCFYFNDREQQLEGTFKLRLPDGASPYYLAFGGEVWEDEGEPEPGFFEQGVRTRLGHRPEDIRGDRSGSWIEPREARMVPREKAAFAYGETVRQNVDPALMEWAGAGVFRARVFPLAPKRLHRVVVGYDLDLARAGEDLEYALHLPADIPDVDVDLHVAAPPGARVAVSPAADPVLDGAQQRWSWSHPGERSFRVRIPGAGVSALTSPPGSAAEYFALAFRPEIPVEQGAGSTTAVFLVDTSYSSRDRFPVWLDLVRAILENNRDSIAHFGVLFFDVDTTWWRGGLQPNDGLAVADLVDHAHTLALEGATDLGAALRAAASPPWAASRAASWDAFLMSDGAASWGEDDVHALSDMLDPGSGGSLFAYTTGLGGTDERVLAHLARESGGAVFSVTGPSEVAAASTAHRSRPWRIDGVFVPGCRDLLLAGRPKTLFPGQTLKLVGRGRPAAGDEIELSLSQMGAATAVRTRIDSALASALAGRAFGEIAVAQLEELGRPIEEQARSFATHFRVTGQTCSLLMLESEEDYRRHGIEPAEDAEVVRGIGVAALVSQTLRSLGSVLESPKARFLAFLDRMGEVPGVEFEFPPALATVAAALPEDAFRVEPRPLDCACRRIDELPEAHRRALESGEPDYEALLAEALRRLEPHGPGDALRALSTLVELNPGDGVVARDVGTHAMHWGPAGHAYHLYRRVARARPYEPQTYLAMARCLARAGKSDLALLWYEVALAGEWPQRFGAFRRIVGLDYLHFLRSSHAEGLGRVLSGYATARLDELYGRFEPQQADLLVTITWNTDRTDVDLHVLEPTGERCYYQHRETELGGELTDDVTQGYGPEMYVLRNGAAGEFRIGAHYYSGDPSRSKVRTRAHAAVYLGWGTPDERRQEVVVPLTEVGEMHDIGTLTLEE